MNAPPPCPGRCRRRRPGPLHRALAVAALLLATGPAAAFELLSGDELARDRAAPEPMLSRSLPVPGAPRVELLNPDVSRPVKVPVDIVLRWTATEGASIDTTSFRVLYGRLGLDVTQRLAAHARLSASGLEAPNAKLPGGRHRLVVLIADNQQRTARHEIVLEVAESSTP